MSHEQTSGETQKEPTAVARTFVDQVVLPRLRELAEQEIPAAGAFLDQVFETLPELVLPTIESMLASEDPLLRVRATSLLGYAFDVNATDAEALTQQLLHDHDPDVRSLADEQIDFLAGAGAIDAEVSGRLRQGKVGQ